ncbi:MAG: hypothetical protein JWM86_1240 [Thermoleophilia bacterium]|nr:hypothetical protein [Thermoleophilia bacterium]
MRLVTLAPLNANPAADRFLGDQLQAVRHYVVQAVVATRARDGVEPTKPFWHHTALEALAAARASNDAAAGAIALGARPYDYAAINQAIDSARSFLRSAVDRNGTPFMPMITQASRVAGHARDLVDDALSARALATSA